MKKKLALLVTSVLLVTLTGCSSLSKEMIEAMNNQVDIQLSVTKDENPKARETMEWTELDQLRTFINIRRTWDDKLNTIQFDVNSKNGVMFVDTAGNWCGNNTLYNVFQNKAFVEEYWNDGKTKSALAQAAINEFDDITAEGTGLPASVNAYFNIIPTNQDGTSGMYNIVTRAEAMSALYRGDTQVVLNEENKSFTDAVGESQFNLCAQQMDQYSWLDTSTGSLNKSNYNEPITKAEWIYMIVQKLYKSDYESVDVSKNPFNDCKNAGRVADKQGFTNGYAWKVYELEYCLQNKDKGLTEDLYKALLVAYNKGILSNTSNWSNTMRGGDLINMLINVYDKYYTGDTYLANAKLGANAGQSLVVKADEPSKIVDELPQDVVVQKIKDISNIDKLIEVYGDEIDMTDEEIEEARKNAEGYTIEPVDKYMLVDFCSYLNVRVGPSTDFSIKKSVPKETKIHIVGRCAENGWYRVIADGKISYQCGVYFSDLPGQDTSNLVQEYETDENKEKTPLSEENMSEENTNDENTNEDKEEEDLF